MSQKYIVIKPVAAAVGAALLTSLAFSSALVASDNPFAASDLRSGYLVSGDATADAPADSDKGEDGKCGEGKCGKDKGEEGKCGKDKGEDGKCGKDKGEEGKCGEDKGAEGSCGGDKAKEGSCGGDHAGDAGADAAKGTDDTTSGDKG